ncbi:MAG: hypothetical protein IKN24_02440, partial [Lachnospiraceae bacterium]|nr:hypothetical protein [Lachnospiraceae bacterium]
KEGLRYFDTVNVSNTTDLLNNLKNNTKIVLEPGTYDFSTVDMSRITNPAIVESYGEVDIQSISNVGIEAKDGADVLLCVDDAYSPVINFTYCSNITLRGVTVGHNVEPGYCSGSVVHINSGSGITIDKCKLFLAHLRYHNPDSYLLWTYGMLGSFMEEPIKRAVEEYSADTGDKKVSYMSLTEAKDESVGSRCHPGVLCHEKAAQDIADRINEILKEVRNA